MKIAIVDTLYPDFVNSLPDPINGTYDHELRKVLARGFGTADFYSHALADQGWQCMDILANHDRLQRRWAAEEKGWESGSLKAIVLEQLHDFQPDVVFMQDLSFFDAVELEFIRRKYLLAGQCSCPFPKHANVEQFDVLFTSFPHYVESFKRLGVPVSEYLPLAFDPRMLDHESPKKQYEIAFVGGVGKQSHWRYGTAMLERVAELFRDQFIWFGYGRENLEAGSPLIGSYAGPAWGRDAYSVYGRSKIVINRHGEVAAGYSNNLRMYETTGMGALLLTEDSQNLTTLFPRGTAVGYRSPEDLIDKLYFYLECEEERAAVASNGQLYTLQNHTYAQRMKQVSKVLMKALDKVAA